MKFIEMNQFFIYAHSLVNISCGVSALRQYFGRSHFVQRCSFSSLTLKCGEIGIESMDAFRGNKQELKWIKIPLSKSIIPPIAYLEEDFELQSELGCKFVPSPCKPSPVQRISIRNRDVYFKRDDLIRLKDSNISGNKARKMLALNQIPSTDFPQCVVSYGGPQSNSMLAIAAIVHSKNIELKLFNEKLENTSEGLLHTYPQREFFYFTKKVPRFLKKNPSGNFFRAKLLGMKIIEVSNDQYMDLFRTEQGGKQNAPLGFENLLPSNVTYTWVPQGGACGMATVGGEVLAKEIILFWSLKGNGRPLTVLLPGGTCSTALILHKAIRSIQESSENANKLDIKVVVIPCVGDEGYASRQMMAMSMALGGSGDKGEIPSILKPAPDADFYLEGANSNNYLRFGEPNHEILNSHRELEESGVYLDLLYGAPAWSILFRHWSKGTEEQFASHLLAGRELLYVHSGGLEGINSQLMRYRHKGMISGKKVQHPPKRMKKLSGEEKN